MTDTAAAPLEQRLRGQAEWLASKEWDKNSLPKEDFIEWQAADAIAKARVALDMIAAGRTIHTAPSFTGACWCCLETFPRHTPNCPIGAALEAMNG